MKNFLEATDINRYLQISLTLEPVGFPDISCCISENDIFSGVLTETRTLEYTHELLKPLSIAITLSNKQYSLDGDETAVMITDLSIDGIKLLPDMLGCAKYINDHDFTSPTNYIGFNGTWELNTEKRCFYHWWHQVSGQGWLLHPTV